MYWTHHFAHHETLSRACSWLTRLGVSPDRIEAHSDGIPRLAVSVHPAELAGIEMVINAVERSDPDGRPSFWDVARLPHVYPSQVEGPAADGRGPRGSTAIGWHPTDSVPETGDAHRAFPEALERWAWWQVTSR